MWKINWFNFQIGTNIFHHFQRYNFLGTENPNHLETQFLFIYISNGCVVCASIMFPSLEFNWTRDKPPMHTYYSDIQEDNYMKHIYNICDKFINDVHFSIFKKNAPQILENSISLVSNMVYWYTLDHFTYLIICGSNIVHLLPRVVPHSINLQKFLFKQSQMGFIVKFNLRRGAHGQSFHCILDI